MGRFLIVPDFYDRSGSAELARRFDLGYEYNDFYMPAILEDEREQQRLLDRWLAAYRPALRTMHGAFYDVHVFSVDPLVAAASRLRIRQSAVIAERLDAQGLIFHSNINPFLTDPGYIANWRDKTAEFFLEITAEYPGLEFWLENMFDDDPAPLKSVAELLSERPNFGLCLDYGHAAISPLPLAQWAEALAPYIRHVHINDNDRRQDLHLPLGGGCIDWDEFLALRSRYFPAASVLLEVSGAAAQQQSVDFLRARGAL